MKKLLIAAMLILASCGDNDERKNTTTPPATTAGWNIGPQIGGKNYSIGLPSYTNASFIISPDAEPHYITKPVTSLAEKQRITLRYKIEGPETAIIYPKCCINSPSVGPTLYFQVKNDNWSTDGNRWWATFASPMPMTLGEHQVTASLNDNWTSVSKMSAQNNPVEFNTAKRNASRVGFTLGGGDGYGHGVRATELVTFTILEFRID